VRSKIQELVEQQLEQGRACPLVVDGGQIASEALTLLAALMEKLHASVALQDLQRHEAHIKMTVTWLCQKTAPDEVPIGMRDPDGEQLSAPINWRWKLWAAPDTHFHANAFDVVLETAKALARFLPAERMPDVPAPPAGPAGGSSGPAELGIPVGWARKIRH
jgi:hypothetical protein